MSIYADNSTFFCKLCDFSCKLSRAAYFRVTMTTKTQYAPGYCESCGEVSSLSICTECSERHEAAEEVSLAIDHSRFAEAYSRPSLRSIRASKQDAMDFRKLPYAAV